MTDASNTSNEPNELPLSSTKKNTRPTFTVRRVFYWSDRIEPRGSARPERASDAEGAPKG